MLDPGVRRFLSLLAVGNHEESQRSGIEARREQLSALLRLAGGAAIVQSVEDRSLHDAHRSVPVRIYTPLHAGVNSSGLIYFHGGGLVAGTIDTHDSIARSLAAGGGCRVISVGYRLAPEHPFPAALDDALLCVNAAAARTQEFGIDPARLGICGDSAGAALAAAVCQQFARQADRPLALQVLICPILDYALETNAMGPLWNGYLLDRAMLEEDLGFLMPADIEPTDPRISPLRAGDFSGLPRTLVHTAQYDPLRDAAQEYANRLQRAGVEVAYTCHPGMIHLFYGLGAVIPYASIALAQIGSQIKEALA